MCIIIVTSSFWLYHKPCYQSTDEWHFPRSGRGFPECCLLRCSLEQMYSIPQIWVGGVNFCCSSLDDGHSLVWVVGISDHLSLLTTSYLSMVITLPACFGALLALTSSHDVMIVHNDVHIWLWLATFRTLCIISKVWTSTCGFFLSGILLDDLRSLFRYSRFFIHY